MTGFKILENITIENYQSELTLNDINNIVDAFAYRKDITTARHALRFSREVISAAYKDIQEVANTVYKLMNGVSVKVKETINEDGSITPAINYAVPQTIAELKAWTWELIVRDYEEKKNATYDIADIAELQTKVELLVDKTIQYSKVDGSGDWNFSHQNFNQLKYINDIPGLIFRETFDNRVSVIKNGGTPTDVVFEGGKITLGGANNYLRYPINLNGTYSIIIRFKPITTISSKILIDFRENSGTGYIAGIGNPERISATTGNEYVNSVLTNAITLDSYNEVIVSGMTINSSSMFIGLNYVLGGDITADIDLIEIYSGTLTPEQVKLLSEGKIGRELPRTSNTLLDYDSTNSIIENRGKKYLGNILSPLNADNWTPIGAWTFLDGVATANNSVNKLVPNDVVMQIGATYLLEFDYDVVDTQLYYTTGGAAGLKVVPDNDISERKSIMFVATDTYFYFDCNTFTGSISNVSLRPLIKLTHTDISIVKNGSFYAALFNGNTSKIDCGCDFIGTKAVTILGFIDFSDWGENANQTYLVDNGKLSVYISDNDDRMVVSNDGLSTFVNSGVNTIIKGNAYFFVITIDEGGIVNFYLADKNGALALSGTANQNGGARANGVTNVILGNNNSGDKTYNGLLPKLRIEHGILSLSQCQQWVSEVGKEVTNG